MIESSASPVKAALSGIDLIPQRGRGAKEALTPEKQAQINELIKNLSAIDEAVAADVTSAAVDIFKEHKSRAMPVRLT